MYIRVGVHIQKGMDSKIHKETKHRQDTTTIMGSWSIFPVVYTFVKTRVYV